MSAYGGFDIYFTYQPSNSTSIKLSTSVVSQKHYTPGLVGTLSFQISTEEVSGLTHVIGKTFIAQTEVDSSDWSLYSPNVSKLRCRMVMADELFSLYCNDLWCYSYVSTQTIWTDTPTLTLTVACSGSIVLENVRRVELSDPREAVYIDYESTADAAIQSIIQQRPIQIFSEVDRKLAFTYSAIRDEVDAHHITSYEEMTRDNAQVSSDGLVYYSDVAVSISEPTASAVGLVTRLYRLSELNNGAINAAARLQIVAYEHRKMIGINMRFDPRIQVADRLFVNEILTGSNRTLTDDVIVEDLSISLENGKATMNINARRKM